MGKDVRIYSVFHKPYWFPDNELYVPIQVGVSGPIERDGKPIIRDDSGDNISQKNRTFCEMTAVYWIWKNAYHDYVGLDHYRRHFCLRRTGDKKARIVRYDELSGLLSDDCILLPKQRHYWIETSWSQYAHAHHETDLVETRNIIQEKYPDFVPAFDKILNKTHGHRFNMMIMPWKMFSDYCTWLFDILFELEKRLNISSYNDYDSRVFGFIAERLVDVYVERNHIRIKELPYVFMDDEHWVKKILGFIRRKFS